MKSVDVDSNVRFPGLLLSLFLILSGFFLFFSLPTREPLLMIFLLLLFLTTAILMKQSPFRCLIVFVAAFPLLPSRPEQLGLPAFTYYEFWFLCLVFCWTWKKIGTRPVKISSGLLNLPAALFVSACFLSMLFGLMHRNLLLTDVFLIKLTNQSNICIPEVPFGNLAPIRTFLNIVWGVFFFLIVQDVLRSEKQVLRILQAVYAAALGVSVLGILQYLFKFRLLTHWVEANPNLTRINSTISDPNALGTYLGCCLAVGFALQIYAKGKQTRIYWIGNVLLLIALLMTASRTAIGSVLILLFLPVVSRWTRSENPERWKRLARTAGWWTLGIVGIGFALVSIAAVVDNRNPQPKTIPEVVLTTLNPRVSADIVLKGRLGLWKSAARIFQDNPLYGAGLGLFPTTYSRSPYYEQGLPKKENAHNYFLQLLAETGVFGTLFFLSVLFAALVYSVRRNGSGPDNLLLRCGVLFGLAVYLVGSITGHPLLLLKMQFVFWGLLGCLTVLATGSSARPAKKWNRSLLFFFAVALTFSPFEGLRVREERSVLPYEAGFHGWEKTDNQLWRWTQSEARAIQTVYDQALELNMRQLDPRIERDPSRVSIYLNEELLDSVTFGDSNWKRLRYYLPDLEANKTVSIRIVPDRIFIPQNMGIPDPRTLGVILRPILWTAHPREPIGVYEPEEETEGEYIGRFQWTRIQASFPLDRRGSKVRIRIKPNLSVKDSPIEARFSWFNKPLQTVTFKSPGWQVIDLPLPDDGRKRGILGIRVSRTWNPFREGRSGDTRDLGIAIASFDWN